MKDKNNNEILNIIENNSVLLNTFSVSTILFFLSSKIGGVISDNVSLYKEFKDKKIVDIRKPIILPNTQKLNKEKILKVELSKQVVEFIKVLHEKLPYVNFSYLHSKMENLNVVFKNFKFYNLKFNIQKGGDYSPVKNVIRVQKETSLNSIDHELFHVASSFYDKTRNISFSGFRQTTNENNIGEGLNEGYTQLLTERYFSDIHNVCKGKVYPVQVDISKYLEEIIGQKEMEKMYFNADLYALIKELEKYESKENIINFILNVDFIHNHVGDKKLIYIERTLIQECFNDIFIFLMSCYSKKIKQLYISGKLRKEHVRILFNEFAFNIKKTLILNREKKQYRYTYTSEQDIESIKNDLLNDLDNVDNVSKISKR